MFNRKRYVILLSVVCCVLSLIIGSLVTAGILKYIIDETIVLNSLHNLKLSKMTLEQLEKNDYQKIKTIQYSIISLSLLHIKEYESKSYFFTTDERDFISETIDWFEKFQSQSTNCGSLTN